jgi:hypothetical protein
MADELYIQRELFVFEGFPSVLSLLVLWYS